jgi:peptidoglycan/LPS O-acetylase OafA/YrhL
MVAQPIIHDLTDGLRLNLNTESRKSAEPSIGNRVQSLDVLRGYAALSVVIAHTTIAGIYNVEPIWSYLKWTPLRIIWGGHQAVILFFIISGFALSHMYYSRGRGSYPQYAISRLLRLYAPYIASIAIALVFYWIFRSLGFAWDRGWMNTVNPAITWQILINHVLMIGTYDTGEINPPIWSIVFEMRLSLIFPAIAFLVNRFGKNSVLASVLFSILIGAFSFSAVWPTLKVVERDIFMTLHYATFFFVGSWLYARQTAIREGVKNLSGARVWWWVAALALYSYPFDNPWSTGARIFGDLVIGVGASLMIALSMDLKEGAFFKVGRWLGNISYSLYLNHALVLNLGLIFFFSRFGALAVWLWTLPISILLAFIAHRLVEVPSHQFSRRWGLRKAVSDQICNSQFGGLKHEGQGPRVKGGRE